ncbi:MAG: hypothetical protein JRD89_12230 [Deltaproteobacteria bacterium]|nr:hypothetical protein [Deltaproteobacteria bacterium]
MLEMIYKTEAEIPAGFESEYVERDGKWELQVIGAKSQTDVDKTMKSLAAERVITTQLRKENEKVITLQAELDNKNKIIAAIGDGGFDEGKLNEMADARAADRVKIATMERDHLKEKLDETNGSLTEMRGRVDSSKIQQELHEAMKGEVRDDAQDIFSQLNSGKFEIVNGIVLTKDGEYDKPISVAEVVKIEVANRPANFMPTSSGGGAGGGRRGPASSANPMGKDWSAAMKLVALDIEDAKAKMKSAKIDGEPITSKTPGKWGGLYKSIMG